MKAGLPLLIASLALAPLAQAEPALGGRWKASFATNGNEREAEVTIDVDSGSWTTTRARRSRDQRDACAGRALPITLADSGTSTVQLRIEAAKAVPGCRDRRARLTVVDTDTLEGEFEDGGSVRLVRRP